MFIGFLEYIISQIVLKPGYIPGDYVGANDLFSEEGPHSQWAQYQVCANHFSTGCAMPPFSFVFVLSCANIGTPTSTALRLSLLFFLPSAVFRQECK